MIYPPKLQAGDTVYVAAPATSMGIISAEVRKIATDRLEALGLRVVFGEHIEEMDEVHSSSIESRVSDLHAAFANPEVKMILPVIGGFNSNQLLRHLDYDLIAKNPKIIGGYSDITALNNAITTKTGLVTYSSPAFSSFGERDGFEYTLEYFKKCFFADEPYELMPSETWSNDKWYMDQDDREFIPNEGPWVIQEGEATGTLMGGNLCTLQLLHGTEYMPSLENTVLFLEDDSMADIKMFDRDLQSLIHSPEFGGVKGIVIGRFEIDSEVTEELVRKMIREKKELAGLPVVANVDFGHTQPMVSFPIGGEVTLKVGKDSAKITVKRH